MTNIPPDRIIIDGVKLDANVARAVNRVGLSNAIDLWPEVQLVVNDPDRDLLRTGLLFRAPGRAPKELLGSVWQRFGKTRLQIDGVKSGYRLSGLDKDGDVITVRWEHEFPALMRRHTRYLKQSRGKTTLAGFVARMAREVKEVRIPVTGPNLDEKQPIEPTSKDERRAKDSRSEKGFADDAKLTIKKVKADSEQRKVLETALTVADDENAGELATLALLVALTQESAARNLTYGDADSEGPLQVRLSTAATFIPPISPRDVEAVCREFLRHGYWKHRPIGAIGLARRNPDWSPGRVAQETQGSAYPSAYDPWEAEARSNLEQWGGAGKVTVRRQQFVYERGKADHDPDRDGPPENSVEAARRLTDLVQWRVFVADERLVIAPDPWLLKARPRITLGFDTPGVHDLDFEVHANADPGDSENGNRVKLTMAADIWDLPPGAVCMLDASTGDALQGRWLVGSVDGDLGGDTIDVVLVQPRLPRPEPAPRTTVQKVAPGLPDVDTGGKWAGTKAIIDDVVTPFLEDQGLRAGPNPKRTPAQNKAVGGSATSDHLTTNTNSYATDYPTFDGEKAARKLALEFGWRDWQPNSYLRHEIKVGGRRYSLQILWGAGIAHGDHIHVGVKFV